MLDQVYEVSIGTEESGYRVIDLAKDNKKLYSLTTNNYVLEFVEIISEATFGLLTVVPKDEFGKAVTDVKTQVIDGKPLSPGLQEIKEWAAVVGYVSNFPDINGNGIPDIPDYYRTPHLAGERSPSLSPNDLFRNGNGIMATTSVVGIALLSVVALILIL